ncbi:MAG: glycosylase, partial [Trebonia sp.]
MIARRIQAGLRPDPARVVARLFLPGEELHSAHSRASQVVGRVMSLADDEAERLAAGLLHDFGGRHHHYQALLRRHASIVSAHIEEARELTAARALLLGATFTAEYAAEGAALCNPSAVLGPDQEGLGAGQARIALSVRGIGEGHISSIAFCSAVVGPGERWAFEPRPLPLSVADVTPARWSTAHLRAVLAERGHLDELAESVLHALPHEFESADLERMLAEAHRDLLTRAGSATTADLLRKVVSSAYVASFPRDADLGQRILSPSADEESNGMEDARFTRFTSDDGTAEYRATYTAYDWHQIAPRLLISPDLRVFRAHRLAGPAARNKGMALFPRKVHGQYLALCRSDGESTSLASSADGYVWDRPVLLREPSAPWEMLQVGNCGPPIETDQGWLVLT